MPNTPAEIEMLLSLGLPAFKYKKGDVVWNVQSATTTKMLPCPDCLGSRVWKVTTPAGTAMTMACQRCNGQMNHDIKIPSLSYHVTVYAVRRLTIGQLNNHSHNNGKDRSYMCLETGIGSGSVYDEDMLYEDEHVARDVARIKTEDAGAKQMEVPAMLLTRYFSGISVDRASWEASFSQIYDGWTRAREYRKALLDMTLTGGDISHEREHEWTSKFSEDDIELVEDLISDNYKYSGTAKYQVGKNAIEAMFMAVNSIVDANSNESAPLLNLDYDQFQKLKAAVDMFPALPPPKLSL